MSKWIKRLMGEWRWEKYLALGLGLMCFIDAFVITRDFSEVIRDGAFHSALLFIVVAYLSDLRYRLFPDVRNN